MEETWRDVVGYEGFYEVSDQGRVRNTRTGRVLKAGRQSRGYLTVALHRGKPQHSYLVHRLVLEAFRGPAPFLGAQTCHLDGDKLHNRLDNLAWCSAKENAADTARHGDVPLGTRNGRARLTEADVLAIRAVDCSHVTTAARYGLNPRTVKDIRDCRYWRHLPCSERKRQPGRRLPPCPERTAA
jgi:hypothetical protein